MFRIFNTVGADRSTEIIYSMGRPNAAKGDQKQGLPISRSQHLLASCVTRSYINAM
jgi:hypothetical protein